VKQQKQNALKSYSPYSNMEETCFLEGRSGLIYPGVRIENISFPLTISAVQSAVCSCLANGDKPVKLYRQQPLPELIGYWKDQFDLEISTDQPDNHSIYKPLEEPPEDIREDLTRLCKKAVTIHSGFPVSAFLVSGEGWIPGVNVELASWNLGLCAERVAIARAVAAGYRNFDQIHILAPKSDFCSPCGACRQVIHEWMPGKSVVLYHQYKSITRHFTEHLLPYGFTSQTLSSDLST
jgi:cytidine deaminase